MSNLLKSNYVVKKEEARVIDSNELIASKLQKLASEVEAEPEPIQEAEFVEFKEGLNAEQLELLLDDNPSRDDPDDPRIIDEEAEPDESWEYDDCEQICFSLCLPTKGEMHSDEGILARVISFRRYTEVLERMLNIR